MWRRPLELFSPPGKAAKLSVVVFHRVHQSIDPLFPGEPDATCFEEQLQWLTEWFNILPLSEAVERLASGALPARALSITFDDGYADNCTVALPILSRHRIPATLFVATGYLDGGCMWNDQIIEAIRTSTKLEFDLTWLGLGQVSLQSPSERRTGIDRILDKLKYLPPVNRADHVARIVEESGGGIRSDLMLTTPQLTNMLRAGMEIGAHTVRHPILARVERDDARREIEQGKADLEGLIGEPVTLFAYPNGKPMTDYSAEHVAMVRRARFKAAVSTAWGVGQAGSDRFQLPRFTPWDRSKNRYGLRLAQNLLRTRFATA